MEFRLPETVAQQLQSYDEVARKTANKRTRNSSTVLKRKTKLSFPCPDIFFDLDLDAVYGIYNFFCQHAASARYQLITNEETGAFYLVLWDKITDPNNLIDPVEIWRCYKTGDQECPVQMRAWQSDYEDEEYDHLAASDSLAALTSIQRNPFSIRYQKEKDRHDQFELFIKQVEEVTGLDKKYFNGNRNRSLSGLQYYRSSRYFHEVYYAKGINKEHKFVPALYLTYQDLTTGSLPHSIKVNSLITNSSFYQAEVKRIVNQTYVNFKENSERPNEKLVEKMSLIYLFLYFYPEEYDRSVHLYSQIGYFPEMLSIRLYGLSQPNYDPDAERFMEWFRSKVTPKMFSHWIIDQVNRCKERAFDSLMSDTFRILFRVWEAIDRGGSSIDLQKEPKRWRLEETHDHFSILSLQLENRLVGLPQDLIPQPLKFETELGSITMFQPRTNHEVIQWGTAVRNCVGSAGYDERVLQKRAFLVFALLDGKPWLTSLLTVSMGMLHVGQTVSPCNSSLAPGETTVYHKCLEQALQNLEQSLESAEYTHSM